MSEPGLMDLSTRTPSAALAEIAHVRDTAERIARGEDAGADQVRVIAGLIHQLAEQLEKLWSAARPPLSGDVTLDREIEAEFDEDRTRATPPADPRTA